MTRLIKIKVGRLGLGSVFMLKEAGRNYTVIQAVVSEGPTKDRWVLAQCAGVVTAFTRNRIVLLEEEKPDPLELERIRIKEQAESVIAIVRHCDELGIKGDEIVQNVIHTMTKQERVMRDARIMMFMLELECMKKKGPSTDSYIKEYNEGLQAARIIAKNGGIL